MANLNEQQFEIKVSPVEISTIDYSKSVRELEEYFDERSRKISAGDKRLLTGEFMQLGYALDFISLIKNNLQIALDFEETSISAYEGALDNISRAIGSGAIPRDAVGDIIKKATGFFSVLVWKNLGGGFISSNIGYGININGTNVFVYNRIGRRLQGDKNADAITFYEEIKSLK